jgi:hypothetical protein
MTEPRHLPAELDDAALADRVREWRKLARQGIQGAQELASGYAEEFSKRKRGEVVLPPPVKVKAPCTPAEVTVPAPTRPRAWWRLW